MNTIRKNLSKTWVQVIIFLLLLFVVRSYIQRDAIHGHAPEIAANLLDGHTVHLQNYRGQPLLIHFWASWCGICRMEESSIAAIAKDHAVVTVAMQSGSADEVRSYLKRQNLQIPVVVDSHGEIASRYGATAVPASFIINGKGKIRFVEFGYTTELGLRARLWLAALLD